MWTKIKNVKTVKNIQKNLKKRKNHKTYNKNIKNIKKKTVHSGTVAGIIIFYVSIRMQLLLLLRTYLVVHARGVNPSTSAEFTDAHKFSNLSMIATLFALVRSQHHGSTTQAAFHVDAGQPAAPRSNHARGCSTLVCKLPHPTGLSPTNLHVTI